ncbi:hypothetical protein, partial [Scytonema sp. NUACC26]|uniref:hypothetical protein n=1 Tax=Scytonema sp. NUACC26 TaxID=3140176 RepID=UPI0038B28D2B
SPVTLRVRQFPTKGDLSAGLDSPVTLRVRQFPTKGDLSAGLDSPVTTLVPRLCLGMPLLEAPPRKSRRRLYWPPNFALFAIGVTIVSS